MELDEELLVEGRAPAEDRVVLSMAPSTLPTPSLAAGVEYDMYKLEVEAWQELTDLPAEKRGLMLALSISPSHPLGLRAKVLGVNVGKAKLMVADRVKNLLAYLDTIFGQDEFVTLYNLYKKFEDYKRGKTEMVEQYISGFETMVLQLEEKKIKYPEVIKAFKLLEGSRVTEIEKKMIVSSVKYEGNEAALFKDMTISLRKNAGEMKAPGEVSQ